MPPAAPRTNLCDIVHTRVQTPDEASFEVSQNKLSAENDLAGKHICKCSYSKPAPTTRNTITPHPVVYEKKCPL